MDKSLNIDTEKKKYQKNKEKVSQKKDNPNRFDLTDDMANQMGQMYNNYQLEMLRIGQATVDFFSMIDSGSNIKESVKKVEEEILDELKVPRGKRINWNLTDKYIEIVNND